MATMATMAMAFVRLMSVGTTSATYKKRCGKPQRGGVGSPVVFRT